MKLLCALVAVGFLALPAAFAAPGLERFAGSYTGKTVAKNGKVVAKNPTTITITGAASGLRGTFDYTGILNQAGRSVVVDQKFMITNAGKISGRVTVGGAEGIGKGTVKVAGKTMAFDISYLLKGETSLVQLKGKIVFKPRRALLTAKVKSSDGSFAGDVTVNAFR